MGRWSKKAPARRFIRCHGGLWWEYVTTVDHPGGAAQVLPSTLFRTGVTALTLWLRSLAWPPPVPAQVQAGQARQALPGHEASLEAGKTVT
jgi:hypothetical protein